MDSNIENKTVKKLDIEKIIKLAKELKRAEIKEKEWLRNKQTQQSF